MRTYLYIWFIIFFIPSLYSITPHDIDQMEETKGDFLTSYNLLKNALKESPTPELIWRLGRSAVALASTLSDKNEKIAVYLEASTLLSPFIANPPGNDLQKAKIIHWYTLCYSLRIKTAGLFAGRDALTSVPYIFDQLDRCISLAPDYYEPYFFYGKLYGDLPFFLGGDDEKMDQYMSLALQKAGEEIFKSGVLPEIIISYYERSWNSNRKSQSNVSPSSPKDISDRQYAEMLCQKALTYYEEKESLIVGEEMIYSQIKELYIKYFK